MNRIDRLIIRAQTVAVQSGPELYLAFVEPNGDAWTAIAHLRNRGQETHTIHRATYATLEGAVEHIHAMAQEHPNSRDVPIIINDIPR